MQKSIQDEVRFSSSPRVLRSASRDTHKEMEELPNASSPLLMRRVASLDALPPRPSSRHPRSEGDSAPSVLNPNRQLEDLSRDTQLLNAYGGSDSMPGINKIPVKSFQQHLQGRQFHFAKHRLPQLSNVQSARSVSTPARKGRQSPRCRYNALPALSSSPPRTRRGASFARPYPNKPGTPQSSRAPPRRASARPIASPSSPLAAPLHRADSVITAAVAEDSSADGKQSAVARTRGGRIRVVVRKRPLPPDEEGCDCVSMDPPNVKVAVRKQRVDLTEYADVNDFTFDDAFGEDKHNEHVFDSCCKELLETTLQGGSASCFAYGQTGSGKTHTMLGNSGERGLYILAAAAIFSSLEKDQEVYASLYEIYCNSLFDLLNNRSPVVVREDHNRRMHITGLTWHAVTSAEELQLLINSGADQRSTGSTTANERSSRSHAVLTIQVRDRGDNRFCGTLNLVDLAGSERAADTATNDRQTRQEGAEINKSLLALKECIRALDEKKKHVPFRGSKLTEILRDSFIGNSRTVMIANISASSQNYEHTLNTLRYAFRVKGLSVVNFEPSRARNAPRPLKPVVSDMNPTQGVPQVNAGPLKTTPGRWRSVSSNAFLANRRNVSSGNALVQQRNHVTSSPLRSNNTQGANIASGAGENNFAVYVRQIAGEVVGNIIPQLRADGGRDSSLPSNSDYLQEEVSGVSFNDELIRQLEDRVVARMKLDVIRLVRDTMLRRERAISKLRSENTMLSKLNGALERRAAECAHCRGQNTRQIQQQQN
ncbi:Kinesin-13 4b [Trypanosoma brucei equiperdum]|uniref:Kinesin-like protein n=1 Tax=Trypanosoma brucei equiperdum TaxID=630700 RepID=A0A3L6L4A4_9TRYP|nr:Kinesin-13 4b [Trypanosoma brucei equiperdum]